MYCFWTYEVYVNILGDFLARGHRMTMGLSKSTILSPYVHTSAVPTLCYPHQLPSHFSVAWLPFLSHSHYADCAVPHLANVWNMVWHQEQILANWKNGIIIPLPKKGDFTKYSNRHGITFTEGVCQSAAEPHARGCRSVALTTASWVQAWKIMHWPLTYHIKTKTSKLPSDRYWKKVTEDQRSLIMNLIDFCKAFDGIHRPALLKILKHYKLTTKVIAIIQKPCEESYSLVETDGDTSS